jgi:hypothetical protein
MVIQKRTVQNHTPTLNVEETTTQPHVRKHQIHQQNVHCAEVITLQATKDALCGGNHPASYKGCEVYKNLQQNRDKSFNQLTHRPIQPKINVHDTQTKPPTQMPFAPQTSYTTSHKTSNHPHIKPAKISYISPIINLPHRVKIMFNQLINQNNMVLSLRKTVINRITTNE